MKPKNKAALVVLCFTVLAMLISFGIAELWFYYHTEKEEIIKEPTFYLNYTIPEGYYLENGTWVSSKVNLSIWQIKQNGKIKDIIVPKECLSGKELSMKLINSNGTYISSCKVEVKKTIFNSFKPKEEKWINFYNYTDNTSFVNESVYEEAMWWEE